MIDYAKHDRDALRLKIQWRVLRRKLIPAVLIVAGFMLFTAVLSHLAPANLLP